MRRTTIALLMLAMAGLTAMPAAAAPIGDQKSDVLAFADLADVGDASLTRYERGVATSLEAETDPGVYTLWWVVWNTPEGCATPYACAEIDLFDAEGDTGLAIGYGGGAVVRANGRLRLSARLSEGQTLTGFPYPEFGAVGLSLPETTLIDTGHAEVHLVLRSHQDRIPGLTHSQLTSFNGGCVYDPPISGSEPAYGAPGPNQCADTFFAIFASPDTP